MAQKKDIRVHVAGTKNKNKSPGTILQTCWANLFLAPRPCRPPLLVAEFLSTCLGHTDLLGWTATSTTSLTWLMHAKARCHAFGRGARILACGTPALLERRRTGPQQMCQHLRRRPGGVHSDPHHCPVRRAHQRCSRAFRQRRVRDQARETWYANCHTQSGSPSLSARETRCMLRVVF